MNCRLPMTVTLAVLASTAGCMTALPDLDLSLTRMTAQNRFVVTLEPPATPAPLHRLHSWQVRIASPAGTPIGQAQIKIDGGMPQHGHGLPTRPQVTQELAGGSYLIEGMKFSMPGWWEITLDIRSAQGSDTVTFNTVVPEVGASR